MLEIDIAAWLFLAYITGEKEIPTKEQMMEANELDLLNCMQDASTRYKMDENYAKARDALPDDHWFYSTLSPEYKEYLFEDTSFLVHDSA